MLVLGGLLVLAPFTLHISYCTRVAPTGYRAVISSDTNLKFLVVVSKSILEHNVSRLFRSNSEKFNFYLFNSCLVRPMNSYFVFRCRNVYVLVF